MTTLTSWVIDPTHSEIHFKVKHLVIATVSGSFKSFEGSASTEKEDFDGAAVTFSADTASVYTNQEQRDAHLRSADFFDTDTYPKINFTGSLVKLNASDYKLKGDLTVKDITKPFEFNVEFGGEVDDAYGNHKAGFELTGKINRKEFGLTWSAVTEAGGVVVGDDIKLSANIELVRQ
jgi:polyisoprenoid-binding protein YceI